MNDDLFAIRIDAPINPNGEGCEQYLTWPDIWTGGLAVDMPKTHKKVSVTLPIEPATFKSMDEAEKAWEDYEFRAVRANLDPLDCEIVAV